MINNLYSFSKKAWHVKLFKSLYDTDPTTTFKTMCPYFWTMFFTLVALPLIIVAVLLKKIIMYTMDTVYTIKNKDKQKQGEKIKEKAKAIQTQKEADKFLKSRCYKKYSLYLDYNEKNRIWDLYEEYRKSLRTYKRNLKVANTIKEEIMSPSKILKAVLMVVSVLAAVSILYGLLLLGNHLYSTIDWKMFFTVIGKILIIILFIILLYFSLNVIQKYVSSKSDCFDKIIHFCGYFFIPFILLGKGFIMLTQMIVATYKNYCPIITWKE